MKHFLGKYLVQVALWHKGEITVSIARVPGCRTPAASHNGLPDNGCEAPAVAGPTKGHTKGKCHP